MRWSLRVFGFPVFDLSCSEEGDEVEGYDVYGGETHNFDRDQNPLDPMDHQGWSDSDGHIEFGFHQPGGIE